MHNAFISALSTSQENLSFAVHPNFLFQGVEIPGTIKEFGRLRHSLPHIDRPKKKHQEFINVRLKLVNGDVRVVGRIVFVNSPIADIAEMRQFLHSVVVFLSEKSGAPDGGFVGVCRSMRQVLKQAPEAQKRMLH
jgi:hypothetical protein